MTHPVFQKVLDGGEAIVGGWVTFGTEPVVETMAMAGYDYVGLDTQHTLIDPAGAARLLHSAPPDGPPVLVRVPSNCAPDINRVLDAGAYGVIVPMVNTGEEARAAVAACRYGPEGVRSFGPMRPGLPFEVKALTERVACFVMVETQTAVDNIDDICATPGLTGIYVGPGDLAVCLGLALGLNPMPEPLLAAVTKVGQACAKAGVIAGGHFPLAHLGQLHDLGYRMFTVGADRAYIALGARADVAAARKSLPGS